MLDKLPDIYNKIKALNRSLGYGEEADWQAHVKFEDLTEQAFLREYAWVVLASGMKEAVVRKKFKDVTLSFLNFRSAKEICEKRLTCEGDAFSYFHHEKKIKAIADTACLVNTHGITFIKACIRKRGVDFLEEAFPYIGPITKYHLAKNIGLQVAKPDRHLVKIAMVTGFHKTGCACNDNEAVQALCKAISESTGDSIPVVDIVLWRFATINPDYLKEFDSLQKIKT